MALRTKGRLPSTARKALRHLNGLFLHSSGSTALACLLSCESLGSAATGPVRWWVPSQLEVLTPPLVHCNHSTNLLGEEKGQGASGTTKQEVQVKRDAASGLICKHRLGQHSS